MADLEFLFLFCVLTNFAVGLISVVVQLYLVYFRLDEMLECFGSSSVVQEKKVLISAGPFGRLLVFWSIGMSLAFPATLVRSGGLDQGDFQRFPRKLGLVIKVSYFSAMAVAGFIIVLSIVGARYGFV